jgi:hypothetical protein
MTSPQQIDLDAFRDLAQRLKTHIERKRWAELESLLGFPAVWTFDRSMPVPEGIGHLRTMFDGAVDIHLWVERLLKFESSAGAGHFSINCCLMWGEQGNFKDHEVELDLHFGFHRADGGPWSISYFGVTPGTPENVPFPEEPARE